MVPILAKTLEWNICCFPISFIFLLKPMMEQGNADKKASEEKRIIR